MNKQGFGLMVGLMGFLGLLSVEAQAQVGLDQRVLLVTANLSSNVSKYKSLYKFLDAQSVSLAQSRLGGKYRRIYVLSGERATRAEFVRSLSSLAGSSLNGAIDALVHLHGSQGGLSFADGFVRTSTLSSEIQREDLDGKARALYSTACYGSTHSQDFLNAGFLVASGARAVNAASAYEYPKFMSEFGGGASFGSAMSKADSKILRDAADWIADNILGFENVDSRKVVSGDSSVTISLDPVEFRSPSLELSQAFIHSKIR